MEFNELMEAFAAKCGLPGIDVQAGGAVLEFDDIAVAFLKNETFDTILLRAVIGEPPSESDGDLAKKMLYANHSLCNACGATLCQDPDTKEYVAVLVIPLKVADVELLARAVGNLVTTVVKWKEALAGTVSIRSV